MPGESSGVAQQRSGEGPAAPRASVQAPTDTPRRELVPLLPRVEAAWLDVGTRDPEGLRARLQRTHLSAGALRAIVMGGFTVDEDLARAFAELVARPIGELFTQKRAEALR